MSLIALQQDVGALVKAHPGLDNLTVNSCTTANGDAQYGRTVDRLSLNRRYLSAKWVVTGYAQIAQATSTHGITAALTPFVQHSSDGSSWDTFSTGTAPAPGATLGVTTSATSTSPAGVAEQRVNLLGARRYIRGGITASLALSTSTLDSVNLAGTWVFGGAEAIPVSSS